MYSKEDIRDSIESFLEWCKKVRKEDLIARHSFTWQAVIAVIEALLAKVLLRRFG